MSFFTKLMKQIKALFGKKEETRSSVPSVSDLPEAPPVAVPTAPPPSAFTTTAERNFPSTATASGWPPGSYEFTDGKWYVPYGMSHGGPFSNPQEAYEWINAVQMRDANLANQNFGADGRGSFPVGRLTNNDKAYLRSQVGGYVLVKQNGDIYRDVLAGTDIEIRNAIKEGDLLNPGGWPTPADNIDLIKAVQQAFAEARN